MSEIRRFSVIHPLYMAFFSRALYRDVARNWKGYGFGYLFSVVALCTIPFALLAQTAISDYLNEEAPAIIKQMPAVTVSKGKLSIDRPEPFVILDEKTGDPVIVFDAVNKAEPAVRAKAPVVVLKTEIIVRGERGQTKHIDLAGIDGFRMDKRILYEWLDAFRDSFAVVLYPFAVVIAFIFRVFETAVFAAAGGFFKRSHNASLAYRDLVRLSAVALTPAMVVGALFNLAGAAIPFWWIAGVPISFSYLYYGIKANAGSSA